MNKEITYPFLRKDSQESLSAPKDFTTIAGGSQPNTLGQFSIVYLSPEEKIEEREFWVFHPGVLPLPENVIFSGKTGKLIELMTGSYDIKVLANPTIWVRGVSIEKDSLRELKVGGYGKIIVNAVDALGKPRSAYLLMYADDNRENHIATKKTSTPVDIIAGIYYIHVDLNPDITYEGVQINSGETTEINIPQPGRLIVKSLNPSGEPLNEYLWVHKPEDRKNSYVNGRTDKPLDLPAGTYVVNIWGNRWIENIEIKKGQTTEVNAPPSK